MARKTIEKNIALDDERELYYVTLQWGKNKDGKYEKTTKTAHSKKEARRILREHERERAAGTAIAPVKLTLVDAVEAYIRYKALDCEKTTVYGYENILKNHIKPFFGETQIQQVSVQMLQEFRINEADKGLSKNSISKYFALLYSVFKDACNKEIISKNPVALMERVAAKKAEREYLNTAETAALCKSVKGTKLELPVTLAVYLGLRRGEVMGLRWEDIDFDTGVLRIENTRTKAGGDVIVKDPKTEKSRRAFQMSDEVRRVLLEARENQKQQKEKQRKYDDSGYVVVRDDGSPFSPNYLSDIFREHVISMGMKPIRFHDLRHAFASIANSAGVAMGEISATMGHSSQSITATIYTHDFVEKKTVAVNAVAAEIAKAKMIREAC